jgi:hypothetical protein
MRSWLLPPAGEATVGRAEDADVHIDSAAASRRHALIHVDGPTVSISDLDSRNSTRVNGERITRQRSLTYGDVITFGDVLAILEEQTDETYIDAPSEEQLPPEGLTLDVGERAITVADPIMLHTYAQIRRLAQSPLSVMIVGETGTGKDLAASALHAWSRRSPGPYVSINCAALPEALAESELFGYERGAFSSADRDKAGLLESASGGTAFLDEIGDLPAAIQPKLLRALEGQMIMRLGSVRARAIDVRIVTATNRDLDDAVKKKLFREDLYYRLSAAVIYLPPLRARPRELPLLAKRFLDEACLEMKRPTLTFAEGALRRSADLRAGVCGAGEGSAGLVGGAARRVSRVSNPSHGQRRIGAARDRERAASRQRQQDARRQEPGDASANALLEAEALRVAAPGVNSWAPGSLQAVSRAALVRVWDAASVFGAGLRASSKGHVALHPARQSPPSCGGRRALLRR